MSRLDANRHIDKNAPGGHESGMAVNTAVAKSGGKVGVAGTYEVECPIIPTIKPHAWPLQPSRWGRPHSISRPQKDRKSPERADRPDEATIAPAFDDGKYEVHAARKSKFVLVAARQRTALASATTLRSLRPSTESLDPCSRHAWARYADHSVQHTGPHS